MKTWIYPLLIIFYVSNHAICISPDLSDKYIDAWKTFYPSKALSKGIHSSIFQYEDLALEKIEGWLSLNKEMLEEMANSSWSAEKENRIDARLLRTQLRAEIDKWAREAPHRNSPSLYVNLIASAVDQVTEAEFLTISEKHQLIQRRLLAVAKLCTTAISSLQVGNKIEIEGSLEKLKRAVTFYKYKLPDIVNNWPGQLTDQYFNDLCSNTADEIQSLIQHLESNLLPNTSGSSQVLGREGYASKLAIYTDSEISPEDLTDMALTEIELVKKEMESVARAYLKAQHPNRTVPANSLEIIQTALADMENDVVTNAGEYLEFWRDLADSAARFVEVHKLATLPKNRTLRIETAPESAGPSARIGWVSSAPPFAPNPMTTLYVPSIPDTLPKKEQIEFWASFNKPFNRFIVIHELFPGHYMQNKISRESPHLIRLLFPFGLYSEGWATFCEKVVLDAGWERENKLTLLAHLRKRLENANRAYTSVQAHCQGWNQEKIIRFSTETSLLAPQFAKSLWGRLMRSPMQMTSYFLGGQIFKDLLASERARLGDQLDLQFFMDTILRAGPIPIDEFPTIFSNN